MTQFIIPGSHEGLVAFIDDEGRMPALDGAEAVIGHGYFRVYHHCPCGELVPASTRNGPCTTLVYYGAECRACQRKRLIPPDGARKLKGCPTCESPEEFKPSHLGSTRCQSGSLASGGTNAHCTCDTCF